MKKKITKVLSFLIFLAYSAVAQVPRYVSQGATGDGLLPTTPSGDLQAMINASSVGDEILLSSGTYYPTVRQGGNSARFEAFLLKDGVNITGGYNANFVGKSTDKSILSGDIGTAGLVTDNAYNVVLALNLTVGVKLESLTISDGYAQDGSATRVVELDTDPSTNATVSLTQGAGLIVLESKLDLINVNLENNISLNDGGAIHFTSTSSKSILKMTNGVISGNYMTATGKAGGAIYLNTNSELIIDGTKFYDNRSNITAGNGGAIFATSSLVNQKTTLTIKNALFDNNYAGNYGGAIQINQNVIATVENSIFKNNEIRSSANSAAGGGAISVFNSSSALTITKSKFINNNSETRGGALRIIGALNSNNNLFFGNTSKNEGGAIVVSIASHFRNNTFFNNTSTSSTLTSNAGAIWHSANVSSNIYNSIFVDNTVNGNVNSLSAGTFNVTHSAFNGEIGFGTNLSGSINTGITKERIFVNSTYSITGNETIDNAANANFLHLKDHFSNPVIDAGDNSQAPLGDDLAGNPRLVKTLNHTTNTSTVDLGAYEFQLTTLPVDLISFTAKVNGNSTALNWVTSTERNNSKFLVKRSADGIVFEVIGSVLAKSANGSGYNFSDFSPLRGNNYYRLIQIDLDGKENVLGTQLVKHTFSTTFKVYPNPVVGSKLNVVFGEHGFNQIQIIDSFGKIVSSLIISEKLDDVAIDVKDLTKGIYLIRAIGKGKSVTQKIIK
jgi:predicted outer membrane repeat protein